METLTHSRKSNAELTRLIEQKAPNVKFEDVVPDLLKQHLITYEDGAFQIDVATVMQRIMEKKEREARIKGFMPK